MFADRSINKATATNEIMVVLDSGSPETVDNEFGGGKQAVASDGSPATKHWQTSLDSAVP
jgi:hypothetical protein